MDLQNYYLEEGFPLKGHKLEKLKKFLAEQALTYDSQIQYTVLLYTREGVLAGCGSRQENTLKCIAIDKHLQGEGLLQAIMTQLLKNAFEHQLSHLFLFTKPEHLTVFSDMGFYAILETSDMLLMENRRNGIQQYLQAEAAACPAPVPRACIGAIVMNANPFTLGHEYLVRTAAASCDLLHVFVLSTDSSEFPVEFRLKLVQEGCRSFSNVLVHESSDYLISHATFPDYFLKDKATATEKAALLDLHIFGTYFQKAFHITKRFVGEEPFSPITRFYNEQMKKVLPAYHIEVIEIPRYQIQETIVSATYVRRLFLEQDLQTLEKLVPKTTFAFLVSPQGMALREKLLFKEKLL